MVAGLVAGPAVGLAVGLIGGIHRYFWVAGPVFPVHWPLFWRIAGGDAYRLNKEKVLGIIPAMLFAVAVEFVHLGLAC